MTERILMCNCGRKATRAVMSAHMLAWRWRVGECGPCGPFAEGATLRLAETNGRPSSMLYKVSHHLLADPPAAGSLCGTAPVSPAASYQLPTKEQANHDDTDARKERSSLG